MISYLCNISGVSRSGYYRYFSSATIEKRKSNEIKDLESKESLSAGSSEKDLNLCQRQRFKRRRNRLWRAIGKLKKDFTCKREKRERNSSSVRRRPGN